MSIYEIIIPCFSQMLRSLSGQLEKGEARAAEIGFNAQHLLEARLAPDMHNLAMQVRFTCTQAIEAVQRLTQQPVTTPDTPQDMESAKTLIQHTIDFLAMADAAHINAASGTSLSLALPNGMTFDMSGDEYATHWAIPQFYFHLNTAYNILRHNGVPLGKADYVQHIFAYLRQPVV